MQDFHHAGFSPGGENPVFRSSVCIIFYTLSVFFGLQVKEMFEYLSCLPFATAQGLLQAVLVRISRNDVIIYLTYKVMSLGQCIASFLLHHFAWR